MFFHIYLHRLKCVTRDRQTIFWTAVFPLLLSTLFGLAFSNLNDGEAFTKTPIALVDNEAYQSNPYLQAALEAEAGGEKLFDARVCSEEDALRLLDEGAVVGVLRMNGDGGLEVSVKRSGLYQTMLAGFADSFMQQSSAYAAIARENPAALKNLTSRQYGDYFNEAAPGAAYPDNTVVYFFALIAMTCLYGGFLGVGEVSAAQGNQSDVAARTNMSPVHKLKLFGCSLCAAATVQFATTLILIAYLRFVLSVQFGDRIGYILLTALVGCLMGVSFGAMIGALTRRRDGVKVALMIGVSMILSFLAGLNYRDMKLIVAQKAPALSYLNPANLISDAFYALYYYTALDRYLLNIALLLAFTALFFAVVYFVMRRQKYASL